MGSISYLLDDDRSRFATRRVGSHDDSPTARHRRWLQADPTGHAYEADSQDSHDSQHEHAQIQESLVAIAHAQGIPAWSST